MIWPHRTEDEIVKTIYYHVNTLMLLKSWKGLLLLLRHQQTLVATDKCSLCVVSIIALNQPWFIRDKKRSLTQFVILLCSKLLLIICPGKGWHSTFSKHLINSGVFGFTLGYPWKTCMSSLPGISLSKLGSWCTVYGYISDIRLTVILQDTRVRDFLENNSKHTSPTLKSVR